MKLKSMRGFSLVELMIVVAIIGILAAIAIPNFMRFQTKARQSEARADLSAIYAAQKAFNAEWSQYYGDFVETGYVPEGTFRYEHGFTASVNSPANYTGAIGAAAAATRLSTAGGNCGTSPAFADFNPGAAVNNCSVDRAPTAGALPGLGASALTAAAFVAHAQGNIDQDAASDNWSINESKQIFGPCSAVVCTAAAQNGGDLDN